MDTRPHHSPRPVLGQPASERPPRLPSPTRHAPTRRRPWAPGAAAGYWATVALAGLLLLATGTEVAVGAAEPAGFPALVNHVPARVLLAAVTALAVVLAAAGTWMRRALTLATTGRLTAARAGRAVVLALAWGLPALAALTLLDAELLALVGYLPLLAVTAPFNAEMRASLEAALTAGLLLELVVAVGLGLWAGAVLAYQRATAIPGRPAGWTTPAAAARWGRVAAYVAATVPAVYALTRFVWMVYPLGIDRELWEAGRSDLLAGVWLGAFGLVGAWLTIGLTRPWSRRFPRWIPGLGRRRVPVAAAVVPACAVALLVLPAGTSMLLSVLDKPAGELAKSWAAVGPTLLWPLWGVALAAAALGYALARRGEPVKTR
ncbi:hypothetical protein [Georgenia ruanii]|uniref:Uncharacterized protein n=1 Tax=Georgenia ruanii TaxID=348442 RepID=A0A7J9USH4_9MICO|nr:hypothetical protein [Georgenia ruanii]MPV87565.1 hypothetical protein [Georgenia ruanii]